MAIATVIAEGTAAANATLETTGNVVIVATKLGHEEYVFVHIYGLGGDTEVAVYNRVPIILSRENNSAQLVGPCKYEVYKDETDVAVGVGYYA